MGKAKKGLSDFAGNLLKAPVEIVDAVTGGNLDKMKQGAKKREAEQKARVAEADKAIATQKQEAKDKVTRGTAKRTRRQVLGSKLSASQQAKENQAGGTVLTSVLGVPGGARVRKRTLLGG